jgi:hypothetical protein
MDLPRIVVSGRQVNEARLNMDEDIWFRGSVVVSVLALIAWALAAALNVGEPWTPWISGAVVVLALGSNAFRTGLRNRNVVWTKELQIEQQRHLRQIMRESMGTILLGLGIFVSISLVKEGILPQWIGGALFLATLAAWFWFRNVLRRYKM